MKKTILGILLILATIALMLFSCTAPALVVYSLDDLTDVDITGLDSGDILIKDGNRYIVVEGPWENQYPATLAGLYEPNWQEIVSLEDLPYIGIGGGVATELDNTPEGSCDVGLTIIASDYLNEREIANDFEFNMAAALGAIEKLYVDYTVTGIPIAEFQDTAHDIRAAVATGFRCRKRTPRARDADFIRYDIMITFYVAIYNPLMP